MQVPIVLYRITVCLIGAVLEKRWMLSVYN